MRNLLFTLFAYAISNCFAQTHEPFVRLHMAASLGIGITGRAEEMSNGALMANFAMPIEFRKQWYVIPELYGGAFRSPKYPNKVGYFFESYPRIRHKVYSVRIAKGLKTEFPKFTFLMSVGAESLLIFEPCCYQISKFSQSYGEKLYRTIGIPAQLETRFQINKRGNAFLNFNARYDINKHRNFGSLNTGLDVRFLSL